MTDATEHAGSDPGRRISGRYARRVGDYQLLTLLGQGAMGAVYLAEHVERTGERLALKVMSSHLLDEPDALRRFELELASLVTLRHPAIVAVHDAGTLPDGRPWYAMDYVEGENLRDAMKRGIGLDEGLSVLGQMADALAYLHAHGLVHRDFKPDNVLVDGAGVARLTDFGLARGEDRAERLTRTDEILGTPRYMAPEQVSRTLGEVGPWTDVFSFGAVLYELLTGRTPYMGATSMECFTQITEGEPIPAPSSLVPAVDRRLEALCLRMLEREPEKRFADGEELLEALSLAVEAQGHEGSGRLVQTLSVVAVVSLLLCAGAVLWALVGSAPGGQSGAGAGQPRHWALLMAGDAAGAAKAAGPEVPARDRAWIAGLAGDRAGCEDALAELSGGLARLTRAELAPLVSGLAFAGAAEQSVDPSWEAITVGEEHLALGRVSLALRAFELAGEAGALPPEVRARARFGLARARLAQGEVAAVLSDLAACRAQLSGWDPGPLLPARLDCWEALVRIAAGEGPPDAALEQALAGVRANCPGLPEAVEADWLLRHRVGKLPAPEAHGRVGAARLLAARDPAVARDWLGRPGGGSFLEDELLTCLRGADGPAGLLLARGATLAALSEAHVHAEAAARACELLELAVRLRPTSTAAWVGLSRARLVLHDLPGAAAAREQASRLLPKEPWVQLLSAQLLLARLEERRIAADLARGRAEAEQELLEPLRQAQADLEAAAASADRGSPLELEARLRAGEVARELLDRLGRAGRKEEVGPGQERLFAALTPLHQLDVAAVASARDALGEALLAGDPHAVFGPGRALAEAAGRVDLAQARALHLLAGARGAGALEAGRTLRAVATDLPAQALLAVRRGLLPSADPAWLDHAAALCPDLPAVVFARERAQGMGRSVGSLCALARALQRDPVWTAPVLEALGRDHPAEVLAPSSPEEHLAQALSCLARARHGPAEVSARLRHQAILAATARLQASLVPSPAAHLLRATSWSGARGALRRELEDDLLAVRAGAPGEWTSARARLELVAPGDPAHRPRLDELLELGCAPPEGTPAEVVAALARLEPGSFKSSRSTSEELRQSGFPRLATALILPWLKDRNDFDREGLLALLAALPLERRPALEPLVAVRGERDYDLEGGFAAARRAISRAVPAGRAVTIQASHLTGGASWTLIPRVGPERTWLWERAWKAARPETLIHVQALIEGHRQARGFRQWDSPEPDPELTARARALGLQDTDLLEIELARYVAGERWSEAALAVAATLAFLSRPPDEWGLHLSSRYLRDDRNDESEEDEVRFLRSARGLVQGLQGLVGEPDLLRLALADLTLDLAGRIPWDQRAELVAEAKATAESVDPAAVRFEHPCLGWWRRVRARVAAGELDAARQAIDQVFAASNDPREELRPARRGRDDPWVEEIVRLDPRTEELTRQSRR